VIFYRLIKPDWAKKLLKNKEANPKFVREIDGNDTYDGVDLSPEYLKEMNEKGYNIFYFPNHPSKNVYTEGTVFLAGKHIDQFNYIFVDMDLKDKVYESREHFLDVLSRFPLKPTKVISSGHGVHAYWAINGLSRDEYIYSQLALIKYFKTDDSIYTVLQLMRLEGYLNTKDPEAMVMAEVIPEASSGETFTLGQFPQELFSAIDDKDQSRAQQHIDRLEGRITINTADFIENIDELPESFLEFISNTKNASARNLWTNPQGPPHNDRSKSDLSLMNILFKNGFNRKEAFKIISNSQKALSHGNRLQYAEYTVDKVYSEKLSKFKTVAQHNKGGGERMLGDLIRGSEEFDTSVLGNPWRKRELLGLIAGTGVGKTTVTLRWFRDAIRNNMDNDDIYVFFSLEMAAGEIVERWNNLVGKDSPLAERLYVIGAEDEKFEPRTIGLQEVLADCQELKQYTGKNLGMVAIDHVGIISKHIDIRKKHTFSIDSEQGSGFGNIRTLSAKALCTQLKVLVKMLDTKIVVLTQTTKEKGVGDLPIGKDGAYGISEYENIMDRIITLWQPLKTVSDLTNIKFLAWQYVKIRNKSPDDKVQESQPKLMTYDLATGDFRNSSPEEYAEFNRLMPIVIERRDAVVKKKGGVTYSIHVPLESLNRAKASLGLVNSGDKNAPVEQVQSNQLNRFNSKS